MRSENMWFTPRRPSNYSIFGEGWSDDVQTDKQYLLSKTRPHLWKESSKNHLHVLKASAKLGYGCLSHRLYSLVPEEAKLVLLVHELGLRASCNVHLYEDDDGFQCSSQQEESTTTDCTNAHNQKFAAGFRALCPDSDRNKVNSGLPPLLEEHSGSVRDGEIILYTRRQATRVR